MFIKAIRNFVAAGVLVGAMFATAAQADPISGYEGTLQDGVTAYGDVTAGCCGSPYNDYWQFQADSGTIIDLTGLRLDGALDLAFNLYLGTGTDTNNLTYLTMGDDELPPNIPGPFGDPQLLNFVLPSTGFYTVEVFSFDSTTLDSGINPNYQLTESVVSQPVPAPPSISLLGLGLIGVALVRRRRK